MPLENRNVGITKHDVESQFVLAVIKSRLCETLKESVSINAVRTQHRILIATDGSRSAQAALATAVKFPWPDSSQVRAVIARAIWLPAGSELARAAVLSQSL